MAVMAKFYIKNLTIQVIFLIFTIPGKAGMRQHKFTLIVVIKFCNQPLPSQPFLGRPFWFHNFFTMTILNKVTFFSSQNSQSCNILHYDIVTA